jgi:hypothetical protein
MKVVGAAWVQFWIRDAELQSIDTEAVLPLVKRYEDCVPSTNPDYGAIKSLLTTLTNNPTVTRYDFLNRVRLTLRESSCIKVQLRQKGRLYHPDLAHERRYQLNFSLWPG